MAQRLRPLVLAAAESMEQFAYLPARQTADALDRAFAHCDDVRAARKASGTTIWTRKAGARPDTCRGGLTLSLDLERAFDSVPWATLEECLVEFGVPADLISLILFLHENARYTFTLGGETVNVEPQQGIRQGCGMSPTIWTLFSFILRRSCRLWHRARSGPTLQMIFCCSGSSWTIWHFDLFLRKSLLYSPCSGVRACASVSTKQSYFDLGGAVGFMMLPGPS